MVLMWFDFFFVNMQERASCASLHQEEKEVIVQLQSSLSQSLFYRRPLQRNLTVDFLPPRSRAEVIHMVGPTSYLSFLPPLFLASLSVFPLWFSLPL